MFKASFCELATSLPTESGKPVWAEQNNQFHTQNGSRIEWKDRCRYSGMRLSGIHPVAITATLRFMKPRSSIVCYLNDGSGRLVADLQEQ